MPRNQTKEYVVRGYFGVNDLLHLHTYGATAPALVAIFKVNSVKQAQERFLKKYGSLFSGYWIFEIMNNNSIVELLFIRQEDGVIEIKSDQDSEFPFGSLDQGGWGTLKL